MVSHILSLLRRLRASVASPNTIIPIVRSYPLSPEWILRNLRITEEAERGGIEEPPVESASFRMAMARQPEGTTIVINSDQ